MSVSSFPEPYLCLLDVPGKMSDLISHFKNVCGHYYPSLKYSCPQIHGWFANSLLPGLYSTITCLFFLKKKNKKQKTAEHHPTYFSLLPYFIYFPLELIFSDTLYNVIYIIYFAYNAYIYFLGPLWQTGWLKRGEMYCFAVLEARIFKLKIVRLILSLKLAGESFMASS